MQVARWIVAVIFALLVGFSGGVAMGKDVERKTIANDCRQSGGFAYKRTGFTCEIKR
jgi:hypothetical protein